MRNKNDYKKENVIDLEKNIPDYVKNRYAEGLTNNLLNRFMCKPDFMEFNGYVGQRDLSSELNQIPEESDFRRKNQLQPIINTTIATENYHLSFQDFIRRLSRQGVDTDNFDTWGRSQQFNWVPPVDIDKIINFRDYYWIGEGSPEYITIKNPANFQKANFEELKLALFNNSQNRIQVSNISDIPTSTSSELVLLYEFERNRATIARVNAGVLEEVEESSDFSQSPTVNEFIELDIPISNIISNNTFTVENDYSDSGLLNNVVSIINGNVETLVKILEVEYNENNNLSTFTVEQDLPATASKLSFHTLIMAEMHNYEYISGNSSESYTGSSTFFDIGKAFYFKKVIVESGNVGSTSLGGDTLTDSTKTFTNVLSMDKKYELKISQGNNSGIYKIRDFIGSVIEIDSTKRFFAQNSIAYEIYEIVDLESLLLPGFMNYDVTEDEFYIDSQLVTKNVSLLINELDFSDYVTSDWTIANYWIHKNQVETFSNTIQARIPILEYENYMELAQTASLEYEWRYSVAPGSSYITVDDGPNLLEIQPINGQDIAYQSSTVLEIPEKYGDLTFHLNAGDNISFNGFSSNNGVYQIQEVRFDVLGGGDRAVSRIILTSPVNSTSDNSSSGFIYLTTTSRGDPLIPEYDHWEFSGIKNIRPSGIKDEKNPLLDEYIEGFAFVSSESRQFNSLLGEVWQEFTPAISLPYQAPLIELDASLHDLCLFEDYQEGDIRVYIDGIRQYGNFQEISQNNSEFITAIKFDDDVVISPSNRVRVELGEYFRKDMGKRNVLVKFNSDTTPYDRYNLVNERRVEQQKSEINQYPLFRLFDVFGNVVPLANPIFKFKENKDFPILPDLLRRIEIRDQGDFVFEQLLFKDDTDKLLTYKNINEYSVRSIWRRGYNNEIQIPEKLSDGEWDVPNSWYFNIQHKNEKEISLRELFRHFRTIIQSQKNDYLGGNPESYYHAIKSPNYGLGGTIKEHNDNLDILASFTLLNNANPIEIIKFAGKMYEAQLSESISYFYENLEESVTSTEMLLVNFIENNKKFDQWFGDSSSLEGIKGIKGMIATAAIIGAVEPHNPEIIEYNGNILIRHHDGHISSAIVPKSTKINKFRIISKRTIKVSSVNDLPNPSDFDDGDYITQLITPYKDINLYQLQSGSWEIIDVDRILASMILEVEKRLFEVAVNSKKIYDYSTLDQTTNTALLREAFNSYYLKRGEQNPLLHLIYDPSDPYTWNYSASSISTHPVTGQVYQPGLGSWQAVYEDLFGTAYPHIEPWKMQGYIQKPQWWDNEYLNTNPAISRTWTATMWNNILDGLIPATYTRPDGVESSGASGEVTQYIYIPVNTDINATNDGIESEELIPPYWNSTNSSIPEVRSPFDKDAQDIIVNANATFIFGQNGYNEWEWRNSSKFIYDQLIAAYRQDPMRVVHRFFGNEHVNVDCLQVDAYSEKVYSHVDSIFHGDVIGNNIFKINGLFQWFTHFNRYNGFDGSSSEYRDLWKEWDINLGYLFGNVINTDTFDLRSESIDMAPIDYNIRFKHIEGLENYQFKAIDIKINKIPSILSKNREASADWLFDLNFKSPDSNSIKFYKPENFPFRRETDTQFKIYSFPLLDAGIRDPIGFIKFTYDNPLSLSTPTNFGGSSTVEFEVAVDGSTTVLLAFDPNEMPTVGDAINIVNESAQDFRIKLEAGDIIVESLTPGQNSSVQINDINFFNGLAPTPPSPANGQSGQTSIEFLGYFDVPIESSEYLNVNDRFEIVNGTAFSGEFSIRRVLVNSNVNTLRIFVNETPTISSNVVDGFVIPDRARTLPWETGQEVYFNTSGSLPSPLLDYIPYNIIKVDDYTFEIAENLKLANQGVAIEFSEDGTGSHKVGRVRATFKPLNGKVDYPWRRHFADTREVAELNGPIKISTIQNICDIVFGYEEYLADVGVISDNERLDNSDEDSGRARDWQLELEKFIDWSFMFRSLKNDSTVESEGTIDPVNNVIELNGNIPWPTGSEVTVRPLNGTILPQEVSSVLSFLPFYVIRNANQSSIQLALTFEDALNGNSINLTDGSGNILVVSFKNLKNKPVRTLNPYTRQFSLTHDQGLPANLIKGNYLDVLTTQKIYDNNLEDLTEKELAFFRRDRYSVVKLLDSVEQNIGGGNIFIDGIEHAIIFNNYSTDNSLIYDSFLGINTPRFFINFVKPMETTKRPTISGLVVQGDRMTSSIEKAINDMRFYYDTNFSFENENSTREARKSLGYEGRVDYMDDLGVSGRSQFIFWQGYIQSKGTKTSLDAFSQHRKLDGISVDEFWAYRLCRFGDNKQYLYPELVLTTEDVSRKELRLEFVPPTGGTIGLNYTPIRLTDRDRWLNQPDLLKNLASDEAYYFNATVTFTVTDVQNKVFTTPLDPNNNRYLKLNMPILNVIVSYEDSNGDRQIALENQDYEIINLDLIQFTNPNFTSWSDVVVGGVSYDYDAESPSKIIDKSSPAKVVADVPIWNPAFGHHNPVGRYPIDITSNDDPAKYNNSMDNNELDFWSSGEVGKVWFDTSINYYVPYFDKNIFPSIDDRSLNWGKLADFGDVNLYQWIKTTIPPEEWDERAENDRQEQDKPMKDRVTGTTKKILYRNVSGTWYKESPIILQWNILEIQTTNFSTSVTELEEYLTETNQSSTPVVIYKNGKMLAETIFTTAGALSTELLNLFYAGEISEKDYLTIVKPIPEPTEEELEEEDFAYYIPHSKLTRFNNIEQKTEDVYYYWVQDLKSEKLINNTSLTLFDARREMKNMVRPYMFIEGLQFEGVGYGVLFGPTFDPENNILPTRFTQCIVKGLKNTVKDNNRYVLRFVKNFTLRDELNEDNLSLKNVHWEWKLFRKNQAAKIDSILWEKVIESVCGYALKDGELDLSTPVPSFERETYDRFVRDGHTRIGIKRGQVILDKEPLIEIILSVLLDPNREFTTVNITDFVNSYNIEDPSEALLMLEAIYNNFTEKEVNDLFFEILKESIIIKREHPDFLKTSWVSIDVAAKTNTNPINIINIPKTYASDFCFLEN